MKPDKNTKYASNDAKLINNVKLNGLVKYRCRMTGTCRYIFCRG